MLPFLFLATLTCFCSFSQCYIPCAKYLYTDLLFVFPLCQFQIHLSVKSNVTEISHWEKPNDFIKSTVSWHFWYFECISSAIFSYMLGEYHTFTWLETEWTGLLFKSSTLLIFQVNQVSLLARWLVYFRNMLVFLAHSTVLLGFINLVHKCWFYFYFFTTSGLRSHCYNSFIFKKKNF